MALLVTQPASPTGITPTMVAASAGGDTVTPGPTTTLEVSNGGGGSITVTVDSVQLCNQGADHNLSVVVAAGARAIIGPLDSARYGQPVTGLVNVTYSGVTSVTVGVRAV